VKRAYLGGFEVVVNDSDCTSDLVHGILFDSGKILWERRIQIVSDLKMLNKYAPDNRAWLNETAFQELTVHTVDVEQAGECARHFVIMW